MERKEASVGRPTTRGVPRGGAVEAARRLVTAGGCEAPLGVVLGTGLGGIVSRLDEARSFPGAETGWLARSTATGHAGRIAFGRLRGVAVVVLQGRVHGYEGFPPETLSRGVELLAALGVRTLLLTNASGGLRPDMRSGELVIVTDHIDLVRRPWDVAVAPPPAAERPRAPVLYDPTLADLSLAAARRAGCVARRGTYAFLSGPSYETRAEYRMLRGWAADVVGMSTVPEVVTAARLGLGVAACSVVTNVACPDAPSHTDAEDVCRLAASAAVGVGAILDALADRESRGPA